MAEFERVAEAAQATLAGSSVLNVNSTAADGDVVLIHDPQPAGLALAVKHLGARVVWRCHVGIDAPNQWSERAWEFLQPYLAEIDAVVVSRAAFAPPGPTRPVCT
jgi:trehalose synthase